MTLEKKIDIFRYFKNPKFTGAALLVGFIGLGLGVSRYDNRTKEVERVFIASKGDTNASMSIYEKVDFIRSRPGYRPTNNAVEYFNDSRPKR